MRALEVVIISAIMATGLTSLFMQSPFASQPTFRELLRRSFALLFLFAGSGIREKVERPSLSNREIFASVWFLAFVPILFASAYTIRRYWP